MTEMALIKLLFVLLMIAKTQGWESSEHSLGEAIMKTILESCYGMNSFPNPVVIFGDFNTLIEEVSIIRINEFTNVTDYGKSLKSKASSVVLMEDHPNKLLSHLRLLRRTKLWDNLVPFFIIGRNTAPCTNSRMILGAMWMMEIVNSMYICPNFVHNSPEIYTLNPITNYAPHPWKSITNELDNLNIFRQNFDSNISCTHLTYDKTKILDGYNIVAVGFANAQFGLVPGRNYFKEFASSTGVPSKALRTIIIALNASGKFEFEINDDFMKTRYLKGSADLLMSLFTLQSFLGSPVFSALQRSKLVAVVKLKAEVSTLEKIYHLWSTPVLVAAAVALAVLFLILMIKGWSFGSALLDITRFLTYTSIQTNNRYQSFRIYFTTMLIFIVISNGVFQGKIAAFLTTRERSSAIRSIDEAIKLGYQMYTHENGVAYAKHVCPRCEFKGVSNWDVCVELVLNGNKNLCVMGKEIYESRYILLPLDRVGESFTPTWITFKCRREWPLRDRFNGMIMRVVESGLPDFWEMSKTRIPKAKRQSMEADRASAQYRPVALVKLDFAFQLLAAGLALATLVFCLELCWARYVNP